MARIKENLSSKKELIRISKRITVLVLSIIGIALQPGCTVSHDSSSETPVITAAPNNTTYPMPPLNGKTLTTTGWHLSNGQRAFFSDFKGQVLVLDFYATWCIPCRNSIPHLVQLQERYSKEGLRVVGLNVGGPDDLDKVPAFAREFKIQYQLAVPDDELNDLLLSDNSDIPQTFVFDRRGLLKKRFVGFSETSAKEMDEAIESALQSTAD